MTKKELKWRLRELPDASSIADLVEQKVITKDEARELLFNKEEPKKVKELEEEVRFLRELVDKLTDQKSYTVIEKTFKEYVPIYERWFKRYEPIWTSPYVTYTSTAQGTSINTAALGINQYYSAGQNRPKFSSLNK